MECKILRDQMLDVLYGEADDMTTRRVEEHRVVCAACGEEWTALRTLRRDLVEWKLPEGLRPRSAFQARRPTRLLAAAAALLLALGGALGLSGSELRYEDGRVAFRLGRADREMERLLVEQEARHHEEIRALKASLASSPSANETALLGKVEALIRDSEERQTAVLHTSLADFSDKTEARRRYDLARVSAGLSYLDGKTGEQVARATDLVGYVLQASQKR